MPARGQRFPDSWVTTTCAYCGKEFEARKIYFERGSAKHCSMECRRTAARGGIPRAELKRTCERCGKIFYIKPAELGKNRRTCSKKCQRTQWKTFACGFCGKLVTRKQQIDRKICYCSVHCYRRSRRETEPERRARELIQASGLLFERQAQIGRWTLDFLVAGIVAVEVDGEYWHGKPGVKLRDQKRDAELLKSGIKTIRVPAAAFMKDPTMLTGELSKYFRCSPAKSKKRR